MHKGKTHSIKEGYEDFARSEGAEAKIYIDSVRTNNPFGEGLDDIMDEESRRRETGYYVKGTTISKGEKTDTPDLGTSRKSALNMLGIKSPLNFKGANSSNSSCWKGYKKVGTKPSPSGTGETVNDCKKI